VEQVLNEIRVGDGSREMNALLEAIGEAERGCTRHFSQAEDFFLMLEDELTVPSFPIHHDVRQPSPGPGYIDTLLEVTGQAARLAPQVLKGLSYFFDPSQVLQPCFFRVYRLEDRLYLYLLRMDLAMRASESAVLERGTNDSTPRYRSRRLYLEPSVIPLEEVDRNDGRITGFKIHQTVSQTWIYEYGRGYHQQGIWMDADLTKFFSRLFLPREKRSYPYYPYLCKYKTVCQSVIRLDPANRSTLVPLLDSSLSFLLPEMERIQAEIRSGSFSEDLEVFRDLKARVPPAWYEPWANLKVSSYLNEAERKEYRIDD
jgi:hypothetical protein